MTEGIPADQMITDEPDLNETAFKSKAFRNASRDDLLKFTSTDIRQTIVNYARLISEDGSYKLEFDYKTYEALLAEQIATNNPTISVEDNDDDFKHFKFGEVRNKSTTTSAEIYLKLLNSNVQEIPEDTQFILDQQYKGPKENSLESLFNNLLEVCREFRSAGIYDHKATVVNKLESLAATEADVVELMKKSGADWSVFQTLQIKHLPIFYHHLKELLQKDSDFITTNGNVPIDEKILKPLTDGFEVLAAVAKTTPECSKYLLSLPEEIKQTVMSMFYPDASKLICPLNGFVGDDDEFEGYFNKSTTQLPPTLISDFCHAWNEATFKNSVALIALLTQAAN